MVVGVNLVLGLLVLATFWAIGRSLDQTRSGVVNDNGTLVVVSAVCPGERLEAVRLFRINSEGEVSVNEELWVIEGDGDFPERFEIGEPLQGLNTTTALTERIGPNDELVFRLRSNQLQVVDAFQFVPADVTGVVSVPELSVPTVGEFTARAVEATPCG